VDGVSAFSYPLNLPADDQLGVRAHRSMPGPVRAFADNQPVTSIVNTIRDLLARQPVHTSIWTALAWCAGILLAAYALSMATYHRKIA
jgi:ABC-2 type transport system permease protein